MRASVLAVVVVIILLAGALAAYSFLRPGSPTSGSSACPSNYRGTAPIRTTLTYSTVGHITTFNLPESSRVPNAITVAPDGSVWFGEEAMPAFAHLFQNGTLLEYVWPGTYPPPGAIDYSCGYRTQIWGVALWNGTVWATDTSGDQLVNLNPATGDFHFYTLSANAFPDYLVAGLDGRLWFTELFVPAIVSLDQNGTSHTYTLPTGFQGTPTQIYFVNSSYALYDDAGQAGANDGGVYSFNPSHPVFTRVAGTRPLTGLTGLVTADGGIWVSEHGPPFIDFYNHSSSEWTDYPNSLVHYASTTLPYFIQSDGTHVWFNEHYGDRIAEIDPTSDLMIEYAISNPPAANLSSITGSQTIARSGENIWFAEFGANKVGFADFSTPPPFELLPLSSPEMAVKPGGTAALSFELLGNSSSNVELKFSDSESSTGVPKNLNATSSNYHFDNFASGAKFTVNIAAGAGLAPGAYVFDVTATSGSVSYSVFLRVQVL
jgi:streptogramin lyase